MIKIERALISVFNKAGLIPFARRLAENGIEIISTGGTARVLKENGIPVIELSDYTGFPEMLDGRAKTLHPKVHGGLLYIRGNEKHEATVREHNILPIDLVVVNLYPFEQTISKPGVTLAEAIENIDIGGPSMLRSAAKNHASVTVVVDPGDYERVADQIRLQGGTTPELRQQLAAKVYARTSEYDNAIAQYLQKQFSSEAEVFPEHFGVSAPRVQTLRYGENPHQKAALYGKFNKYFTQLHGKELSYNNILDLTSAAYLINEFNEDRPTLAILKHTNPCGVGQGDNLKEAWGKAFATDQQAPFGGIIAVNRPLDADCASEIAGIFSEVIIAPEFTREAMDILTKKRNLRLLKMETPLDQASSLEIRSVGADSFLLQERDLHSVSRSMLRVVTRRQPTPEEWNAMLFGWNVVKHIKSNAILYVKEGQTLGVGAGQMSRVDSSRIAVWKAGQAGLSLKESVVCSDAFFPFADGLVAAAEAGATAVIQPGGSIRDAEVIEAADKHNMAMVFTSVRHFRH